MKLFIDTETYSETPIACGVHRYAEKAEILLFAYAFEGERAAVVDFTAGEEIPQRVRDAFANPAVEIWAHNSHFDRTVMARYFPEIAAPERWRDTMVLAYAHGLPGALGTLSEILGLPRDKAKDKDGHRLVLLFSKPQPKGRKIRRQTRETAPEDWAHFKEYCRLDVEALQEVYKRLPKLNDKPELWAEWLVDQHINDRGMQVDTDLCDAAIAAAADSKARADAAISAGTAGAVATVGQGAALQAHINAAYGAGLTDMQRATLQRALADESLAPEARELIALRLQTAKTSVKKFDALKNGVNRDGRLRGCLQFMGAARTGRWTGRLFQPQNLPRGTMSPAAVETAIAALKAGVADLLTGDVMQLISNCIRGAIVAPQGKKLVVADFSNIEGRVLAWLAGEEWKIQAFKDFDAGHGPDLYKATYGRTFGVSADSVTKKQRQIGKVLELAMGYQGGVGAFLTFAKAYSVNLDELAEHTRQAIDAQYWRAAEEHYNPAMNTHGLARETYIACDAIKRAWRSAHPAICRFWYEMEKACCAMLNGRAASQTVGKVKVTKRAHNLCIELPSGRFLCYPWARLPVDDEKASFVYAGVNQFTRKWTAIGTYGGKVVENVTQATARDVLSAAMCRADAKFPIVFSVHDELITECPADAAHSVKALSALMCAKPTWARGLPLAAAGFESHRYKKD